MERRPRPSNEELAAGRRLTLAQRRALAQQIERTAREQRQRAASEYRATSPELAWYEARYRALVAKARRNN